MTRKEIVDILNQFEAEHPVDEWAVNGIHVWPMIKIDLFWAWHNFNYPANSSDLNDINSKNKPKYQKLLQIFQGFIQWAILTLSLRSRKKGFLFVGNSGTNINFSNKEINRYYQPIFDFLSDSHSDKVNVFYYKEDNLKVDSNIKVIKDEENEIFNFLYHFCRVNKEVQLNGLDSFIPLFKPLGLIKSKKQFLSKLFLDVRELKVRSLYVQKLIRKHNIKAIFELCYYGNKRYAYNIAAYNCGIPSYDIQHGGMGNEHVAYANLYKVPKEGYEMLPSHFWLWDDVSYKLVSKWVSKQNFHQCIVGQNPWLEYFFENINEESYPINNEKKIILYTMQYSILEEYIIDTIRNTPKEYTWWIRLHPRKIDDRVLIEEILILNGLKDKVEIQKATFYPLPYLLVNSFVHISAFSGSIIEAALLNIPSIIIDEIGVSSFQEYIESGHARIVLDKDASHLLSIIEEIENPNKKVDLFENNQNNYKEIIRCLVQ